FSGIATSGQDAERSRAGSDAAGSYEHPARYPDHDSFSLCPCHNRGPPADCSTRRGATVSEFTAADSAHPLALLRAPRAAKRPRRQAAIRTRASSFDHLVGAGEQWEWDSEAECLGGAQVDHQLELGRLQDRQLAGLCALEDAAGIDAGLAVRVLDAGAIAHH